MASSFTSEISSRLPLHHPQAAPHWNKKILVVCFPVSRYGDFFGALRISKLCKDHFGSQVAFALPKNWASQQPKLIEREVTSNYPFFTYSYENNAHKIEALTKFQPDAVIGYPCDGGSADPVCQAVCEAVKPQPVTLPLTEYGGYPPNGGFALGVGKGEIGLFIDQTLFYRPKGLIQLSNLSPDLCERILGAPYSNEAVEDFDQEWKLYFGYTYAPKTRQWFVDTVARYNEMLGEEKKLLFVLVGPQGDIEPPPRSRVLSFPFLEHWDMVHLLLASEEECLGTGDLSITDLFSADKTPLAEVLDHKGSFTRNILDLADDFTFKFTLSNLFADPQRCNCESAAKALYQIKTNQGLQKAMRVFSQTIRRDHDFSRKFIEEMEKRLSRSSD